MTFLIAMIVNGDGFLPTSHSPEPKHRPFPSSKRQVEIFDPVIQLPAFKTNYRPTAATFSQSGHRCVTSIKLEQIRLYSTKFH
jgi:hypothetical protein